MMIAGGTPASTVSGGRAGQGGESGHERVRQAKEGRAMRGAQAREG